MCWSTWRELKSLESLRFFRVHSDRRALFELFFSLKRYPEVSSPYIRRSYILLEQLEREKMIENLSR